MPLSHEHKQLIIEHVQAWIDDKNKDHSGSALARKAQVNHSYISHLKNGQTETKVGNDRTSPISDAVFNRLADAMGIRFDGQLHWDFLRSFKKIQAACRKAHSKRIRMVIDGWTRQGKTHSLEHYAAKNDYVLYVKCTQNMTVRGLLDSLLQRLGVPDIIRGNFEKIERIRKIIKSRKNYLIIIDETEVVKLGIYGVIKDISDFADKNTCGFIIAGMDIVKKLENLAGRHKPGFPQLWGRFDGNVTKINMLTPQEVIQVCEYEGIKDKTTQSLLAEYVHGLDMLSQYISDLKDHQEKSKTKINAEEARRLLEIVI